MRGAAPQLLLNHCSLTVSIHVYVCVCVCCVSVWESAMQRAVVHIPPPGSTPPPPSPPPSHAFLSQRRTLLLNVGSFASREDYLQNYFSVFAKYFQSFQIQQLDQDFFNY